MGSIGRTGGCYEKIETGEASKRKRDVSRSARCSNEQQISRDDVVQDSKCCKQKCSKSEFEILLRKKKFGRERGG